MHPFSNFSGKSFSRIALQTDHEGGLFIQSFLQTELNYAFFMLS